MGKVLLLDYEQWWGGRMLPTAGVAGVAVHPDARGSGVAQALLRHVTDVMRERGQSISALFPTVLPLYRSLGWEVVGALEDTRLSTRDLAPAQPATECVVRTAEPERDEKAVRGLYDEWAGTTSGLLTRRGRPFPEAEAFDCDMVALAEGPDGRVRGYLSYDRGRGYANGAGELRVWELVSRDADASRALLASLSRWHPVAATTLWRGPTAELELLTASPVPPAAVRQPWMLRLVDAPAAVAARGFPPHVNVDQSLALVDPEHERVRHLRLSVSDGRGTLEPAPSGESTRVHVRGLALLFSGCSSAWVHRAGLLDAPLPELDAAFAGTAPVLLDYF